MLLKKPLPADALGADRTLLNVRTDSYAGALVIFYSWLALRSRSKNLPFRRLLLGLTKGFLVLIVFFWRKILILTGDH
jgi:hypothetical protein